MRICIGIYNINSVKSPIYRGQGQDFLVKMSGLCIIEGVVSTAFHWYVIYGFGSNDVLYSARVMSFFF